MQRHWFRIFIGGLPNLTSDIHNPRIFSLNPMITCPITDIAIDVFFFLLPSKSIFIRMYAKYKLYLFNAIYFLAFLLYKEIPP